MRDIHRQPHVHKVEAIAESNQRQRDDMVRDQLAKVLARLLEHEQQHAHLLQPVARLDEVVGLEGGPVAGVREAGVHGGGVKVPERRLVAHHVQARRAENAKVYRRVRLLHEACLLAARADPVPSRDRTQQLLHDELARKGQEDGVEGDKGEVGGALAVESDGWFWGVDWKCVGFGVVGSERLPESQVVCVFVYLDRVRQK